MRTLEHLVARADEPVRVVVLDASGVNQLDSSAEAALAELVDAYEARDVRLVLTNVKGPVRDVLRRSGLWDRLTEAKALAVSVAAALATD